MTVPWALAAGNRTLLAASAHETIKTRERNQCQWQGSSSSCTLTGDEPVSWLVLSVCVVDMCGLSFGSRTEIFCASPFETDCISSQSSGGLCEMTTSTARRID